MLELTNNQPITFFCINGMAMTTKRSVFFVKENQTHIIFKLGERKRKLYQIKKTEIVLLFATHELPFMADSDGNVWNGNACINLVSREDVSTVKKYIKENNLLPLSEHEKAHIMLMTFEEAENTETVLNIDNCVYTKTLSSSALVDGIRAKKGN